MNRLNLMGAALLLALFGSPSLAMKNMDKCGFSYDEKGAPFFGNCSWHPQATIPPKEFDFFSTKERSVYANKVMEFGRSNSKYHKEYADLINKFDEPCDGDDNYQERLNLFEFQKGIQKIGEIKNLHREILEIEGNNRKRRKLEKEIKRKEKEAPEHFSAWVIRFNKQDYKKIKDGLRHAVNNALKAAEDQKKNSSLTKNFKKKSKMRDKILGRTF